MAEGDAYSRLTTQLARKLVIRNTLIRQGLAEMLGTFMLMLIGDASVAQSVLSKEIKGDFLSINIAWGVAVTMGVYISAGVSGGHINPAVSLTFAVLGRLSWIRFLVYVLAQYVGAILASACVYGVYQEALNEFDGGVRQVEGVNGTAGIWATYPQDFLSAGGGIADQVLGTMVLMMCVLAVTDKRNSGAPPGLAPISVGLIVLAIGLSLGFNCGYAINPARDLGPRIFTALAGWGQEPFSFRDHMWFWVPVVGPHMGALLGAWLYLLCVGLHLEEEKGNTADPKQTELKGVTNNGYQASDPALHDISHDITSVGKSDVISKF